MSVKEKIELDLTDYEQVDLEIRDEKIKNREKEEIAKNLKNKDFSLKDISEATGLNIEEIEKL